MTLFLDIDGVMVPASSWIKPVLLKDGFPEFSHKAVNALKKLISQNIKVILTTSHKSYYSIHQWENIFFNRGIVLSNIHTLPENSKNLSRKEEITNWLNCNPMNDDFFIIDDDKSLNDLPEYLKSKLILTSPLVGLTDEHSEKIMNKITPSP